MQTILVNTISVLIPVIILYFSHQIIKGFKRLREFEKENEQLIEENDKLYANKGKYKRQYQDEKIQRIHFKNTLEGLQKRHTHILELNQELRNKIENTQKELEAALSQLPKSIIGLSSEKNELVDLLKDYATVLLKKLVGTEDNNAQQPISVKNDLSVQSQLSKEEVNEVLRFFMNLAKPFLEENVNLYEIIKLIDLTDVEIFELNEMTNTVKALEKIQVYFDDLTQAKKDDQKSDDEVVKEILKTALDKSKHLGLKNQKDNADAPTDPLDQPVEQEETKVHQI
jgi:hypothetical protein